MLVVYYNTERVCFLELCDLACIKCFALQKGAYLGGFLRYLDKTFRISRAIYDQYDPEMGNIFEP